MAARPEHPFVSEGRITPPRLADATLILFDRGSDDYEVAQSMLKEARVAPYGVIEVDSVDTARRLVTRGLGVAMAAIDAAVPEFEAGRLARVELLGCGRSGGDHRGRTPGRSSWAPVLTMRELLARWPPSCRATTAVG